MEKVSASGIRTCELVFTTRNLFENISLLFHEERHPSVPSVKTIEP